jgi:hypothetical protein
VVVDYILLRPESPRALLDDIHREAVLFGMRVQDEREATWHSTAAARLERQSEQIPRMTIDEQRASATVEQTSRFLEDYWYAFSDPPYPLRRGGESVEELFRQVNQLLFGDLTRWSIRRWSSDWSDYFTYGLEWWGAFLWTLVREDSELVVWVGASTTD